jgi:hypothetical protein
MSDLSLSILGFPAANRDLTVELRDPTTQNLVKQVQPFLDGTARVTQLQPGAYEMTIRHPNVALPVVRQPIRILPTGDTRVSVLLDPSKFRNTPIEDIPEANLGPVSDASKSIAETVTPLANKLPGEAILAQDWNAMASAVRDLANVVGQLVGVVSPVGHNHPELETKINEMSDNFQQLLETLSASLAELQREIQVDQIQQQVKDVLDQAGVDPASAQGRDFLDLVDQLKTRTADPPSTFGQAVRNTGVQLDTKLGQLLDAKAADPTFATSQPVQTLATAVDIAKNQRTASYGAELDRQRATQRTLTGGALALKLNP